MSTRCVGVVVRVYKIRVKEMLFESPASESEMIVQKVCVCVCEGGCTDRERESEIESERAKTRERERERGGKIGRCES